MPLNLNTLMNGGAYTSKNLRIQQIRLLVQEYNGLAPNAAQKNRIDLLHLISRMAGDYLTSKPPQDHSYKNRLRWQGLSQLLDQIGPEAARLGVRMLHGPSDFRKIGGRTDSYWLELLDPMHRPGFMLRPRYESWLSDDDAVKTKQSFWNYIGTQTKGAGMAEVEYLNESGGPARYEVAFGPDRRLYEVLGAQPFSTERHETHFSGDGWAIFVVSPTGQIYSASHILGKLHHSSFLGGRPVMAAGEMVVDDGVIRIITAKSGHYRPKPEDLQRMVNRLTQIPSDALIRPDLGDESRGGLLVFLVGDFRSKGMDARPLSKQEVLGALPAFGKQAKAMQELGKLIQVPARMMRKMQ